MLAVQIAAHSVVTLEEILRSMVHDFVAEIDADDAVEAVLQPVSFASVVYDLCQRFEIQPPASVRIAIEHGS